MKKFILTAIVLLVITTGKTLHAQTQNSATVKIQTSAICDQCKDRIEKQVNLMSGVKKAELDTATKILTVNYNPKKTSPDKIRKVISNTGYDADDVKANPKAKARLPQCCIKK